MSPYRPSNQRRRSLSVSPSTFHDQHCIDLCHPPTKRVHSRKDLPRQWDFDSWRHGKRLRTQRFSNEPTQGVMAAAEVTSARRFPSTSAAFDLHNSRPSLSQSLHKPDSHTLITDQNISALHSSAFWELHQSITEASEGFVQRMRDWESSRPQVSRPNNRLSSPFPPYTPSRGRDLSPRISSPLQATSDHDDLDSDNDDDVLIFSPKKRARSLGDMDLDSPEMFPTIPPELSHTVASSSTSSLLSLAPPSVIPPSSREEKAIAALALALANGAAGLNDYSAVREALGVSVAPADGASEVGEMWR
ncbi:hypothetical protein BJV78DRAFT_1278079 [Lactifluus subvellereus]|nr:hypothetical protein BJV78DRAFT_1278079 [Lactifluus subvellereus]